MWLLLTRASSYLHWQLSGWENSGPNQSKLAGGPVTKAGWTKGDRKYYFVVLFLNWFLASSSPVGRSLSWWKMTTLSRLPGPLVILLTWEWCYLLSLLIINLDLVGLTCVADIRIFTEWIWKLVLRLVGCGRGDNASALLLFISRGENGNS